MVLNPKKNEKFVLTFFGQSSVLKSKGVLSIAGQDKAPQKARPLLGLPNGPLPTAMVILKFGFHYRSCRLGMHFLGARVGY